MRIFTISARLFICVLCYFALVPGTTVAQDSQLASSVVATPVNTDYQDLAADNSRATASVMHPGVNGAVASERVQFAFPIAAGTAATGVSLRFDNIAGLLQAGLLPNISILTYSDGVATGDQWSSSQLLSLSILQSGQQVDIPLSPAPTKSFNQLELRAAGTVNAYTLNFFDAFGPNPAPLPVQVVSFTATAAAGGPAVRLTWTTASELNSAYFVVERSLDGARFTPAGQVTAAGTTTTVHAYAYLDTSEPAALLRYYRLRQVDQDGTSTYSCVRTCASSSPGGAVPGLSLYPMPARSQATLVGAGPRADVHLLDALGRSVLHTTADEAGTTQLLLPAGLTPGVYVVRTGSKTARLSVEE